MTGNPSAGSYTLKKKTRDINLALAWFFLLAGEAAGKWQLDDTNQTDYPIIKIDLVANQRDYPFTVDGSSTPNQILEILRVERAAENGTFEVLDPFDQTEEPEALAQLATVSGTPQRYDKLANGLFLDPKPSYSYTAGLWVYISRTPSYFLSTDTTKTAGIPDFAHEYLALRPAWKYAVWKGLKNKADLERDVLRMEAKIRSFYSRRNKTENSRIRTAPRCAI
ncbi:hypothetical protein [Dongia sp.]|uniref:hypothetical protein n=1 Tax=Dongia sp. TaxID=1977262 RepID=UPI0037525921